MLFEGCRPLRSVFRARPFVALGIDVSPGALLERDCPGGFKCGGSAASVAGFALIGVGTGPIVPCGFALAARQAAAGPAVGLASASLFSALTRLPAPLATGAIAQALSLSAAFAAFALALVMTAAALSIAAYLGRARRTARKA